MGDDVPRDMVDAVAEALVTAIRTNGPYIGMHCTSALTIMCRHNDMLREMLVRGELPLLMLQNLKLRDDDLEEHTLELFVVLSKTDNHREHLIEAGLVQPLVQLLTASYSIPYKRRILAPLATIISLVCNNVETRKLLSDKYPTLECLQYILDSAPAEAITLRSCVMHTIRKLSENSPWNREKVGVHCVDQILKDLRSHHTARVEKQVKILSESDPPEQIEYIKSIIMLFDVLSVDYENAVRMVEDGIITVLEDISASLPTSLHGTPIQHVLAQLQRRISDVKKTLRAQGIIKS
jgi:hypothetical protein